MTFAEFQIRAFAYNRIEEKKDLRTREIAWASLIGSHLDPKKLPKSKDAFWQIGEKKSTVTDAMREAISRAQKQYLIDKQKAENG